MSETYDYEQAVKDDILEYVKDNIDFKDYDSWDDLEEYLNDELINEDSITGNSSGSYTFSTYQAEEYLCHNLDLLSEVLEEFGEDGNVLLSKGAEYCDVAIRCHLYPQCLSEVLSKIEDEYDKAHEKD